MKCDAINAKRAIRVLTAQLCIFVFSAISVSLLTVKYSLNMTASVLILAGVLIAELSLFRFLDEACEDRLYGYEKNDD